MYASLSRLAMVRHIVLVLALLLLGVCVAPPLTAATAPPPVDQPQILSLLRAGDFAALETLLTGYEAQFEADHAKHVLPGAGFGSFMNSDSALELRLNEWVAQMPKSYAAHLARGMFYYHLGGISRGMYFASYTPEERFGEMRDFYTPATEDLGRALNLNPHLISAYEALAAIARASGRGARGRQILADGLATYPESAALHFDFVESLEPKWGGSIEQVEAYTAALVKRFPENKELRGFRGYTDYARGSQALYNGDYEVARQFLDRAIDVAPDATGYLSQRAQIAVMVHKYDEGVALMTRVLELAPNSSFYRFRMSQYRYYQGRFNEALEYANAAVALDPLNPMYLQQRALVLRCLNRMQDAVRDLDDAVTYGAYDPDIEIDRSFDLAHFKERLPDAIKAGQLATKLSPRDPDAWAYYAQALYVAQDCNAQQALVVFHAVCRAANNCEREKELMALQLIPRMQCKKS